MARPPRCGERDLRLKINRGDVRMELDTRELRSAPNSPPSSAAPLAIRPVGAVIQAMDEGRGGGKTEKSC